MKESTYTLFEQLGLVFEPHCPDQLFSLAEEAGGRRVGDSAPDLVEIAASLCFVLPALTGEPGTYNVISLSRSSRKPESPAGNQGDLDLSATYDAANGWLTVRVAAGERSETCREIRLESLPPATVAGRVLRLLVLLKQDVFYASIDSEDRKEEIAVHGDAPSCGSALDPWGSPSAGLWRVTSGADASADESTLAFPPGFGLSDVQILLHGASPRGDRHLLYSGELDHLTGWGAKKAALRRTERLFPDDLMEVADEIRSLAFELEPWVRRTHVVADYAEALASRQLVLSTDPEL